MRLRSRWLRAAFVRSASSTASSASSAHNAGGPLSTRVGCTFRDAQEDEAAVAAPIGFVRYRETMAQAGQALSFRPSRGKALRVSVRYGCIGAAAMSGRFEQGGVVTANPNANPNPNPNPNPNASPSPNPNPSPDPHPIPNANPNQVGALPAARLRRGP